MGVPAFYRWLTLKYPAVVRDVQEKKLAQMACHQSEAKEAYGEIEAEDPRNEFLVDIDNLYIDMNGIIHPCCHPEDGSPPKSEDEMFVRIFTYIDRIVNVVRPQKLLYLAIDGVAPRAKMNQQRARRFKSAMEVEQEDKDYAELKAKFESEGRSFPAKKVHWDSNVITPGTPFLCRLSKCLYYYVNERMSSNGLWNDLKVIISDANCPGEGEHKIMHFIRSQRTFENYLPNLRHCIHGADADLIMLGLATHEPHFFILRENVLEKHSLPGCFLCGEKTHLAADCPNGPSVENKCEEKESSFESSWKPLQVVSLGILREYLSYEFAFENCKTFQPDLERCIDDFILLCFFVGNDFLPHLPSLSIHKGSIDQMILLYQKLRPRLADYLSKNGTINLKELKSFVYFLGVVEREVFISDLKWKERNEQRRKQEETERLRERAVHDDSKEDDLNFLAFKRLKGSLDDTTLVEDQTPNVFDGVGIDEHEQNIDLFKSLMRNKKKAATEIHNPEDHIKLGEGHEELYKLRYYRQKFNIACETMESLNDFVRIISEYYVEGMRWVLAYYYQGVPSWEWFFPFHYAPFASEVAAYGTENQKPFVLGRPFKPFEQLMAVLPPQSRACLPEVYWSLMLQEDSPILDFYPLQFKEDPDGKRYKWQWVVLLPFIDQDRLLTVIQPLESLLSDEEKDRNRESMDCLVLSKNHSAALPKGFYVDSIMDGALSCCWSSTVTLGGQVSSKSLSFVTQASVWAPGCSQETFPPKPCHLKLFHFRCAPCFPHTSCLLPGTILSAPQLQRHQLEGDLDDRRSSRFNSQGAKRMILGCLGRLGVVSQAEVDSYSFSSNHRRQTFYHPRSDNPYEQEMFHPSRPGHPSQKFLRRGPHRPMMPRGIVPRGVRFPLHDPLRVDTVQLRPHANMHLNTRKKPLHSLERPRHQDPPCGPVIPSPSLLGAYHDPPPYRSGHLRLKVLRGESHPAECQTFYPPRPFHGEDERVWNPSNSYPKERRYHQSMAHPRCKRSSFHTLHER